MRISPGYCQDMARYNLWQNSQLASCLEALDEDALVQDRGAFFGSILATANHLLWGDRIWMSRFAGTEAPPGGIKDSPGLTGSLGEWQALREVTDGQIRDWAEALRDADLEGDLRWHSGALGHEVAKPMALCVVHMFNHQTHHRGQIHALVTSAGVKAPVSDLAFMP